MSSLSHQASLTKVVPIAAVAIRIANNPSHCFRELCKAAATKNASATSSGKRHLHGNCTNLSFGKCSQKKMLGGNIRNEDAKASVTSTHQGSRRFRRWRATKTGAIPVTIIVPSATAETFQLKRTNSGSLECANRKFWLGRRFSASACEI